MIDRILAFSIRNRWLVIIAAIAVGVLGAWNFTRLPIDAVPDITNVQVQVNSLAPGYSPLEVEQRITFPLETAMGGLPKLEYTRSLSRYGLSQVTVVFKDGTDIYFARQLVNERIQQAKEQLPPGAETSMGPVSTGLGEIYMYAVEAKPDAKKPDGEPYTATDLRTIQELLGHASLAMTLVYSHLASDYLGDELEKIPFLFRYEFWCDDQDCNGHDVGCGDNDHDGFDAFQWFSYWGDRPIMETVAAMIFHNLFTRFPNLKVGIIDTEGPFLKSEAVDAIKAASAPHHFLSVTKGGHSAIVHTAGNEDCHIILRGGKTTNYDAASVDAACKELAASGVQGRLMVDFSHANSRKQHKLQVEVARDVAGQLANGEDRIIGVMVESHLKEGRQDLKPGVPLEYGQSITDACIGWEDSVTVLDLLAEGVRQRRVCRATPE